MDATSIAGDLTSAANALTGFSILQNIAFSYGLLKRDLRIRLDSPYNLVLVFCGLVWLAGYVWIVWWCSMTAIEVALLSDANLLPIAHRLAWGRCVAVALFGLGTLLIILVYNYKPFWNSEVDRKQAAAHVATRENR